MKLGMIIVLALCCFAVQSSETGPKADHWSLQPVKRPVIPTISSIQVQPRNPVDSFIFSRLADARLTPSGEAAPAILVRRLHYLLTGLPPAPEVVSDFERHPAYRSLVDQLLNSPGYGERWARHWLDVVRFAETHGFEMNQPRNTAWRYRDYVIRTFNEDKPYDQFVREQIAGDVFDADDATGFLVGGPWDQVKSPDPVLTANQRADELHDVVSTAGSAFLGLTIGCARCHDHKFDPIPQVDYYAVKAVFAGVEHGERERRDAKVLEKKRQANALRKRIPTIEAALAEMEPPANPNRADPLRFAVNARRNVEKFEPAPAKRIRFTILQSSDAEPCIDELEVYSPEGTNVALASFGTKASASGTYPGSDLHKLEHINDGLPGNGKSWISNEGGKGWVELEFPAMVTISKIVWGRDREERFKDRLAVDYRIEVADEVGNRRVVASASDRQKPGGPAIEASGRAAELLAERASLLAGIAVLDNGSSVYAGKFKAEPEATHRLHRGDPMLPRDTVQPSALGAIPIDFWPECRDTVLTADQSRRAAFAQWLVHPRNPLAARVMVNRIWQYHFGQGLVRTASDFGANGARPSHPELLDWLAAEFMENGWGIKQIQRLIVDSATFRQASEAREDGTALDADDRLLWRFPPRRLEAESIRDSILAASDQLNGQMEGPGFSFFEPNENYVRVYAPRADWPEETFRRMIYGTVVRQRPDGVFGVFDCPDAGQIAPKRTSSTTPLQALNLLNSSFIVEQAGFLAKRLEREAPSDVPRQVLRAFALAFQRPPSASELEASEQVVRDEGLPIFCRALLNANEFVYLF